MDALYDGPLPQSEVKTTPNFTTETQRAQRNETTDQHR